MLCRASRSQVRSVTWLAAQCCAHLAFRQCLQVVSTVGMLARLACLANGGLLGRGNTVPPPSGLVGRAFLQVGRAFLQVGRAYFAGRHTVHATLAQLRAERQARPPKSSCCDSRQLAPARSARRARPGCPVHPVGTRGPGHNTPKHWLKRYPWGCSKQAAWLEQAPHSVCARKKTSCVKKQ
jgi:hypothetical protein